MINFLCFLDVHLNYNPAAMQDFYIKLIPLLSPIIVIITFALNNSYTRKSKRIESNRTWYFKVFLEPNLKKTEDFFSKAEEIMRKALDDYLNQAWSDEARIDFISSVQFELANIKRKFAIEVVEGLQVTYREVFAQLEDTLLDFEDAGSRAFEENNQDPYFTYIGEINAIKMKFLMGLSAPAIEQKKSNNIFLKFRQWLSKKLPNQT